MIAMTDISAAKTRIAPHIRATPVVALESGAICDHPVHLKLEFMQHTGSFKVRGALNTILAAGADAGSVVAVSGGNHGAAVAFAATRLGLASTVFAPASAAGIKADRMAHYGADVRILDLPFPDLIGLYTEFAAETGALAIHPYDAPFTLSGQGTLGPEIENQIPELDTLLVSVGGGGLIGGITAWFQNRIRIVAVETEQTASYAAALKHGPGTVISPAGLAANSLGGPSIGTLPWNILHRHQVRSVIVSDRAVVNAQRQLWESVRILCEPGAAAAVAALHSGQYRPAKNERVGVLICGANAAPDWFLQDQTAAPVSPTGA